MSRFISSVTAVTETTLRRILVINSTEIEIKEGNAA
jgi:hypothetical protein